MPCFVCTTCGVQYREAAEPPDFCEICEVERLSLESDEQRWTTLDDLRRDHRNRIEELEPGLTGIGTEPAFGLGQRALLVRTESGNLLWDCITLIDDETVDALTEFGGVDSMAISQPHYYSAMIEWSRALGGVPIYIHEDDSDWVMRHDTNVVIWPGGRLRPINGSDLRVLHSGGHSTGGSVVHWPEGADGRGALLSSDMIEVSPGSGSVSFTFGYPNLFPLDAAAVQRIADVLEPFEFDRIYGAWWDRVVSHGGKEAVRRAAEEYISTIGD